MDDRSGKSNIEYVMTQKINTDQLKKIVGLLLTIIALVFVGKSIWSQKEWLLSVNLGTILKIVFVGVPAYLVADGILAAAWKMLLNWFEEDHLDMLRSVLIYGKSQILKYVPGNLLSLPGRHILSLQYGAEHGPLVGAATFEIIGLLAVSSSVSVLGILFADGENTRLSLFLALTVFSVSLASPFILRYILSREVVSKRLSIFRTMRWGKYTHLIAIWLLYLAFFAIAGFILFWSITGTLGNWDAVPFYAVFSAFTISWLLGTITPGAPAGMGIRESVIIITLSTYIGEPTSILASLVMRIITMVADVVFYLCSIYIEKKLLNTSL
jgi:glycosyltransferase 2 family protein